MPSTHPDKLTVCYFGIFDPTFSRNRIYIAGLRQNGVRVIECRDQSPGVRKYIELFRKHWRIRNNYDVMIVGYPGYIIVPFAKLISRKKVVFDALCTFYEAQIISRNAYAGIPGRVLYTKIIDWLANTFADLILVETDKQKAYYVEQAGVSQAKVARLYIGLDDSEFYFDPDIAKRKRFTVLFRGRLMAEAGIKHVVEAARLLRDEPIDFIIIGFGFGEVVRNLEEQISRYALPNLELIPRQLPMEELRRRMLECHVSLGQFENNERLERTIPHKAFESLAMRLPYITARAGGAMEIFKEGETCLFVHPADPGDLAEKIKTLKNDASLREALAQNGYEMYQKKFTPAVLGRELLGLIENLLKKD